MLRTPNGTRNLYGIAKETTLISQTIAAREDYEEQAALLNVSIVETTFLTPGQSSSDPWPDCASIWPSWH
jgi:hypothetical protein